jgi:hypothetical protein
VHTYNSQVGLAFPWPAAPSPPETILWIPCSIIICVCSVCSWKIVHGLTLIFRLSGSDIVLLTDGFWISYIDIH